MAHHQLALVACAIVAVSLAAGCDYLKEGETANPSSLETTSAVALGREKPDDEDDDERKSLAWNEGLLLSFRATTIRMRDLARGIKEVGWRPEENRQQEHMTKTNDENKEGETGAAAAEKAKQREELPSVGRGRSPLPWQLDVMRFSEEEQDVSEQRGVGGGLYVGPFVKPPRSSFSESFSVQPGESSGLSFDRPALSRPPMGWNSWNYFGCDVSQLNETLIRETADVLVRSGLREKGYRYVNLDDCWTERQAHRRRDLNSTLVPDATRFPSGMRSLADYLHDRDLKFGLYADCGAFTCQHYTGSEGFEEQDAKTFADWRVDYLKIDGCYAQPQDLQRLYTKWRDAVSASDKPGMVLSCSWPAYDSRSPEDFPYEELKRLCSLWRNYSDISADWKSLRGIVDWWAIHENRLAPIAAPGSFNDPDILEVGNAGLSLEEYRTQMSLWAIFAAPLLLGNDLREMSTDVLQLIGNERVIAVNQDSGVKQGKRVLKEEGCRDVWVRLLVDPWKEDRQYSSHFRGSMESPYTPTGVMKKQKRILTTMEGERDDQEEQDDQEEEEEVSLSASSLSQLSSTRLVPPSVCVCPIAHPLAVTVTNLSDRPQTVGFSFDELFSFLRPHSASSQEHSSRSSSRTRGDPTTPNFPSSAFLQCTHTRLMGRATGRGLTVGSPSFTLLSAASLAAATDSSYRRYEFRNRYEACAYYSRSTAKRRELLQTAPLNGNPREAANREEENNIHRNRKTLPFSARPPVGRKEETKQARALHSWPSLRLPRFCCWGLNLWEPQAQKSFFLDGVWAELKAHDTFMVRMFCAGDSHGIVAPIS